METRRKPLSLSPDIGSRAEEGWLLSMTYETSGFEVEGAIASALTVTYQEHVQACPFLLNARC